MTLQPNYPDRAKRARISRIRGSKRGQAVLKQRALQAKLIREAREKKERKAG